LMCDVVAEERPDAEAGVLSGPNLAVEIARGVPTVAISACQNPEAAETVREAFSCRTFRVSVSDDVVGVELAGALKNVLAIGAGMSDGLGFGDNTKGAFLARGLMEMARLGLAMGGRMETFLGPAGVGDLFATAASRLSRNYRLGRALGEGQPLDKALAELGQVAEGVTSSESAIVLARRHGVEVPVMAAVAGVVAGRIDPRQAVGMLMDRAPRMDDFLACESLEQKL
jgi:glycerol-3-phosphate dehydrogenase (NAD(P)+)